MLTACKAPVRVFSFCFDDSVFGAIFKRRAGRRWLVCGCKKWNYQGCRVPDSNPPYGSVLSAWFDHECMLNIAPVKTFEKSLLW